MNDQTVRRAMAELSAERMTPVPEAARVWRLAEVGRRRQKRQRVARIMILTRVFTSVVAMLGTGGIALWRGVDLPSLGFVTAATLVCAGAAGARAMLVEE